MATTPAMKPEYDFGKGIRGKYATEAPAYPPTCAYDAEFDVFHWVAREEPIATVALDAFVTLYVGQSSGQIIGMRVKHTHQFVREMLDNLASYWPSDEILFHDIGDLLLWLLSARKKELTDHPELIPQLAKALNSTERHTQLPTNFPRVAA